jgi:acyl carrier protein
MNLCHDFVIVALAHHLGVDPVAIEGRQLLEDDWGLDSLDLALIASRFEDAARLAIDIDREQLDALRTVAELVALVHHAPAFPDERVMGAALRPSVREHLRRSPRRARHVRFERLFRRTRSRASRAA